MAVKFTFSLLVAFSLFFSCFAAADTIEKPSPEAAGKDKVQDVAAAPEVKDPKSEAMEQYNLGITLMTHGNWKEAEKHLLESIRLDPGHYNPHMFLARVYEKMRKKTNALVQYKEAIKIRPDDPSPYAGLIGIYLDMGLADTAISTAADAVSRGIPEVAFAGNVGWAYYLKGDFSNAEKYLKMARELKKNDTVILNNLGLVYFRQGRYDDALASLNEASELNKNSVVLPYLIALTYNRLGKEDEALKALKEGVKRDPDLEAKTGYYIETLFVKSDPGDLSAIFKKLREEKD